MNPHFTKFPILTSQQGGLVPTPGVNDDTKFLRGDGTWANASLDGAIYGVRVFGIVGEGTLNEVNGFYQENGTQNGKPKYTKDGGFEIFYSETGYWLIVGNFSGHFIHSNSGVSYPWEVPTDDWFLEESDLPAPDFSNFAIEKAFLINENLTVRSLAIASSNNNFIFNSDGSLIFPDGGVLRYRNSVPASSVGAPGDVEGTVVIASDYIYYCTASYRGTQPLDNIWKRVAFSNDTW